MKPLTLLFAAVLCLYAFAPQAQATEKAPAFDRLHTLIGTWQGKDDEGQPATVTYEALSGGSIITETLKPGKEPAMLTVYHMDGDKLLCTHYCSRNNQPRMRLQKFDAATGLLDFDMIDATNLSNHEEGHMHHLVLKSPDADHLVQEWSWHENGQESKAVFDFQRKK